MSRDYRKYEGDVWRFTAKRHFPEQQGYKQRPKVTFIQCNHKRRYHETLLRLQGLFKSDVLR